MTDEHRQVARAVIQELKEQGELMQPGPLYVPPEIHKEHHDFIAAVLPWADDFSKGFRKRVVSLVFLMFVLFIALVVWLAGPLKGVIK